MHNYSINIDNRLKIFFYLSVLSILTVSLLKSWINSFGDNAIYISIPSAFTIYGLMYIFFDRILWKLPLLSKIGLVQTPVFCGKWVGYLKSSVDDFKSEHEISIRVHQTYDKISIYLEGETKESESTMANFRVINPSTSELEWGFLAKNKPQYSDTDYMCYGVAKVKLELIRDNIVSNKIIGQYYTDKGTDTFGEISLKRMP